MPQNCCFGPKNWHFLGKNCGFLVMVAPEPSIICSNTLQNMLYRVWHPQNRVWGPTCDHSAPQKKVLGQKKFFLAIFGKKMRFFVITALNLLIICSKSLQKNIF